MEPEAIAALERRVAAKLDPGPKFKGNDWPSEGRLWFRTIRDDVRLDDGTYSCTWNDPMPIAIGSDGNAMLALIAAMRERGFQYEARSSDSSSAEFHHVEFIWVHQDGIEDRRDDAAGTLPLAVLLAAARALGVENEKDKTEEA